MKRTFPLTDMSLWLVLLLSAVMLPRTILSDLDILREGTNVYYFFALVPFAIWLAIALFRRAKKPFMDFIVLGVIYGLSLSIIHQVLWSVGASIGHHPPAAAISFAENFDPGSRDLAIRMYTVMISMMIGVGSGIIIGAIAGIAKFVRSKR